MLKKNWIIILLAFLPLVGGIVASILAQWVWNPVPILVFKIDVGMVAFMAGFGVTIFLLGLHIASQLKEIQADKKIANTIRESEQGRRRFVRRLDHEIKNPLTGMRAALVNLQEAQSKDERIRAGDNARRAVERLTRLLSDLRKLSDLDERALELAPVDVPELLGDVVDAACSIPAYAERKVHLFIPKVPSPFPMVTGDRDLLVLAVYNLVDNALKFTSAKEPVEVRALDEGKDIVVEVADSGAGISSEDLPKIFEDCIAARTRAAQMEAVWGWPW